MSLKDRTIVVTGGTSGIGEACARHFVQLGANVVMASIQQAEGEALEAELSETSRAKFIACDVTQEDQVRSLIDGAVAAFGRIDAIHCNAGAWGQGTAEDFDDAIWNKVMGVNVKGALLTAKYGIPAMRATGGGTILATTSVAAQIGFPQHAVYCASKAALEALVRCLAVDYAGVVRVVGISPGTVKTPMLAATCQGWDKPIEELYAEVAKKIPVRRLGEPEDVAKAAAFLLSDDASYINGTILTLDGGTMPLPPW
ncbi:SDR family NAD(P)-dependent oxidoreductase [Fuerstiella marisgermanici]|uniref:2,5-dichloro-2,5-cyclohexadiene-1,4-diol dehydrogenase n=1 Tax=Fuerstiella marisgermanici TaxID=1891926 RepID=A0A1P8WCV3_9PLAN|nr:SDR family oxidoreductase [Fuerstiella marisgermanici]APZ91879.1 2,5-dichloro-2,5-cyclohexadiene-1,4-diol dehydrogenase [Fuerstiella marisgermanici]